MAYEPKNNSGSLFVNDRKETASHPDFSGSAVVDGKEYWLSGWKKPGKDGKAGWLSLALKPKDGKASARPRAELDAEDDRAFDMGRAAPAGRSATENLDDEIPF